MKRIPRLKDLTIYATKYRISLDHNTYYDLNRLVVTHYIKNAQTYLGVPLTLEEICNLLSIKIDTFQDLILDIPTLYGKHFQSSDLAVQQGLRASLISDILGGLTVDKLQILRAKELIISQLTYPDSGAIKLPHAHLLLKAIESSTKVDTAMMNLLDRAYPQAVVTQILQINAAQNDDKPRYLTQQEALDIVGLEAQKALSSPKDLDKLAADYGIHDTEKIPEIRASGSLETDGTFISRTKSPLHTPDDAIILDISTAVVQSSDQENLE